MYAPAQTNYSPLYTSSNFVKTIDLNRPVGTTAGEAGTTPTGGVTYNIPIYTPPGTNGLEPSIAVSYNSQGGPGIAGFGWNINGLSVISRSGKNLYHNTEVSPVHYSWTDAFLLDGNRLNPIVGNNADNGTIYATEAESFAQIRSWTGNGSLANPDWFEVTAKDGSKMEFGNTSDSRVLAENGYSVMFWRINRIIDINGNYIDFKYDNGNRDSRIDEIIYTGNINTGLLPYNKIKFNYGNRYETNTAYDGGASLSSFYLLNSIVVISGFNTPSPIQVKKYQFNYGFDNIHSLLKEVVEYGEGTPEGPALNSTIFLYGDAPPEITTVAGTNLAGELTFFSGDFDADGKTNLAAVLSKYVNHGNGQGSRYDSLLFVFADTDGSSLLYLKQLPQGTTTNINDKKYYNFLASDYNKDGRDDIVETTTIWNVGYQRRQLSGITINYTTSSGYTALTNPNPVSGGYTYDIIDPAGNFFFPGDYDGDGIQDYLLILARAYWVGGSVNYEYKGFISYPSKNILNQEVPGISGLMPNPYFPPSPGAPIAAADIVTPLDVDGDGKLELLVTPSYNSPSYLIAADANYNTFPSPFPGAGEVVQGCKVFPGDFNGDRKADMLVRNTNGTWKIVYSTGTSFSSQPFSFNHTVTLNSSYCSDRIVIGDFNGDGKSDILHGKSNNCSSTGVLYTYYSKGLGSGFHMEQSTMPWALSPTNNATNPFTTGDFNGDGRTDLLNVVNNSGYGGIVYLKPNGQERLLQKITDGHNNTIAFQYKLHTDKTSFPYVYNRTVSLDDPVNQNPFNYVQLPMYAVASMTEPDGIGGTRTTSFYYEDAVVHRHAKGFLGFKKVTAVNPVMGAKSVSESAINTQWALPYAVKQSGYRYADNFLLSENFVTTSFVNLSTGSHDIRYFQKTDKTLEKDNLNNKAAESENTYDSYGNITVNVSKLGEKPAGNTITNVTESSSTTTVYGIHNTPVPAKPEQVTVTKTRTGMPAVNEVTSFTYTVNGNPATQTAFAGLPKAVTTSHNYNSFGNITQTTTSTAGMISRSVATTWDAKGRFPETTIKSGGGLSETETKTWYLQWGTVFQQTGADCRQTMFMYDAFGRLSVTMPVLPNYGYQINHSLGWDINGQQLFVKYDFPTAAQPKRYTWFDKTGREIKTEIEGFDNDRNFTQLTTYDNRGRVASKTNTFFPYVPNYPYEAPLVTTTTYDETNRPVLVSNLLNSITTTYATLSGGKVQVTTTSSAGQSQSKIIDATGKTVSSIDNGGQLDFTYDSRGNQVEAKHGTTVLVTSAYDVYGRQISVNDNNAGTVTYEYDAYGQLVQQQDANLNAYNMSYDGLGKITTRTGPEGTTTYEYYGAGTCAANKLWKVTGFNGVVKEYTYDNIHFGELASEDVIINGFHHPTYYSYDQYGNLTQTTYPGGLGGVVVNRAYNSKGYLTGITGGDWNNTQPILTINQVNAYNQATIAIKGNISGSVTTYYYGIPTRYYTPWIQDLNLNWDYERGNLLSRNDAIKGKTETFGYDNLDRLTSSTVNGVQQFSINYDGNSSFSMGNIAAKTDAGNYVYSNQKIHAVNYITNPAGATAPPVSHPTDLQQITYTPFLKTQSIDESNTNTQFTYGPDYQRVAMTRTLWQTMTNTRYYCGDYEKNTQGTTGSQQKYVYYVSGPEGLVAIIEKANTGPRGSWSPAVIHFVYTDHLGSLLTLADNTGQVVAEQNFDAWGRYRNINTWQYEPQGYAPPALFNERGYTGHEHLPAHYLINMNGRMYDPIMGRMLSPDNYVPDPWHTQGYNRYSYANNNPLKYVDPDGNILWFAVGAAALIGGFANGIANVERGGTFLGGFWRGALVGGASAITGGAIAGALPGLGGSILAGSASGIISGGLGAALNGGDVLQGILHGGLTGGIGGGVSAYFGGGTGALIGGAVSGGIQSALDGGNILTGMIFGGISSAGMYHLVNYYNYTQSSLNSVKGMTYSKFSMIGGDYQRSLARRVEFSGILLEDGTLIRATAANRRSAQSKIPVSSYQGKNVALHYHTHWDKPGAWRYIDKDYNYISKTVVKQNPGMYSRYLVSDMPTNFDIFGVGRDFPMNIVISRTNSYSYHTSQDWIWSMQRQPTYNFTRYNSFSLIR